MAEPLLSVEEARRRIVAMARPRAPEPSPLEAAAGLALAAPVVARRDLPGFDNSAMDGFAVRAEELEGASEARPRRLAIAGEVAAGSVWKREVEPGTAVRIMTGAPLPPGADAVIEVELTTVEGGTVLARADVEQGRSVRRRGSDIAAGETALEAGAHLGPAQVALLAALGESRPLCVPRPRVAVLATGDELVDAGQEPGPGQVSDVVGPGLGAAVQVAGGTPLRVPRARDDMADLRRALTAAAEADVVVSVGGVSMGEHDLVRRAVEELGALDFWRVAMRPGKPLAVGTVLGKPFIGLPGNPVSALVGFEVYVLPLILELSGHEGWSRPRLRAALAAPVQSPAGMRNFVRAHLAPVGAPHRLPLAHPAPGQGSHQLRWLARSNALLDVPEEVTDLAPGAEVEAILVDQPPIPGPESTPAQNLPGGMDAVRRAGGRPPAPADALA
jgi:molybdopterin molybdotransferase